MDTNKGNTDSNVKSINGGDIPHSALDQEIPRDELILELVADYARITNDPKYKRLSCAEKIGALQRIQLSVNLDWFSGG